MDPRDLAVAGDVNLAHAWAVLGGHSRFDVTTVDSLTLSASGLPIAFFNGAYTAAPTEDPDAVVDAVVGFFTQRRVPYLLWVREGLDDALLAAGRRRGLLDAGGPPAMGLPTIGDIPAPPPELELRFATGRHDIDDHRAVASAGFNMPIEIAHRMAATTLVSDPDVAVVVGRVAGRPVATAMLARSGETAGVYTVATVPEHRGKGYGEAVTWAVIAEGARRGCTHAVLQASEAGYPVYVRMGFLDLGRYLQLEGQSTA